MKAHTKVYMDYFGLTIADFIPCEICGKAANDLHHIERRGIGGSLQRDNIENLMALCRNHHVIYGDKKQYKNYLQEIHNKVLESKNKYYICIAYLIRKCIN